MDNRTFRYVGFFTKVDTYLYGLVKRFEVDSNGNGWDAVRCDASPDSLSHRYLHTCPAINSIDILLKPMALPSGLAAYQSIDRTGTSKWLMYHLGPREGASFHDLPTSPSYSQHYQDHWLVNVSIRSWINSGWNGKSGR